MPVAEPETVTLRDGSTVSIRPIGPDDAGLVRAIYHEMSDESRRRRFLTPTEELSEEDVMYLTDIDHNRH